MKKGWFLLIVLFMVMAGCGYSKDSKSSFKEQQDDRIIQLIPEKPVRIEFKRNTKGAYSWSLRGEDADKIIAADKKLRAYVKELNK